MKRAAALLSAGFLAFFGLQARAAGPTLTAADYFGEEDDAPVTLDLTSLDIAVTLQAGFADTIAEASFHNPTDEVLEGEFVFEMPANSIVTGYALDIEGEMIDGVLLEQKAAKRAFEEKIREGVDPGLAEETDDGAFRTRVFPINADETRTIRLRFVTPISGAAPYALPLQTENAVGRLRIAVRSEIGEPRIISAPVEIQRDASGVRYGEDGRKKIEAPLVLATQPAALSFARADDGSLFVNYSAPVAAEPAPAPQTVRIFLDTSYSMAGAAERAIAFVRALHAQNRQAEIELIPFATRPGSSIRSADPGVDDALAALAFDGASDLAALFDAAAAAPEAELCLLISDGRKTLGGFPQSHAPCRLFALSVTADADRQLLSLVAAAHGGGMMDLTRISDADALAALGAPPAQTRIYADGRALRRDVVMRTVDGDVRIVAPVPAAARKLSVESGDALQSIAVPRTKGDGEISRSDSAVQWWAAARLAEMKAKERPLQERLAFARRHSVAASDFAFIVLETVDDYVEANAPLPVNGFDDDDRAEYAELLREAAEDAADERAERRDEVGENWDELVAWWKAPPQPKPKLKDRDAPSQDYSPDVAESEGPSQDHSPDIAEGEGPSLAAPPNVQGLVPGAGFSSSDEEIIVTGSRISEPEWAEVSIAITPWSPDRPYLKAAEGKCGEELRAEYFLQRRDFGSAPSFFLEMSDAARRCGDKELAVEIALSALETPISNNDTRAAVADRLIDAGAIELAIALRRDALAEDPDRPQPGRDLALALAARADLPSTPKRKKRALYREAIELLYGVAMTPWDGDYDGIELIALMEANNFAAKLKRAGGVDTIIEKRFRQLLDVDLRIVISWNLDDMDLDLWVDEPGGERAIYSNPLTDIGGRLSNDMTDGYGPEEYLLRRAPEGDYRALTDYFRSDVVNPNGAVAVRATIFTDWGRRAERAQTTNIELSNEEEEEYLLGEIRIGAPR